MDNLITVFDATQNDAKSRVRGVGRYMSLLKDSFSAWNYSNTLSPSSVFINPFINLLQPPFITKKYGKRQIGVIYDLIPIKYPAHFPAGLRGTLSFLHNRLALRTYDHFVTDSETAKRDIVDILHIPYEKISVIYPYAKEYNPSPAYKLPTSRYYLYVGDATWNKNLVNIAKVIKMGSTPCIFVGKVFSPDEKIDARNTWTHELVEFLQLSKNDPRFLFPGYVSDDELAALYKNALCNILLSRDEGFGFSYIEAAKNGTPSLLADTPIFHEIAGQSALFSNPENPQEINKVLHTIQDEKLRSDLSYKALEQSKIYTMESFKDGWEQIIS